MAGFIFKDRRDRSIDNGSLASVRDDFFFPIQQQFDKFVDEFFGNSFFDSTKASYGYPKIDVINNNNNELAIKVAVPGVKIDDLKIEIMDSRLTISGQMSEEYKSDGQYFVRELKTSHFSRELILPDNIEGDPIAELKDGILTLKWKLLGENKTGPKPKQIEIKNG